MKKTIHAGILTALFLSTNIVFADDQHHPASTNKDMKMGNSAQMEQMMAKRMEMMKSTLKLNATQEKEFNAFVQQKKTMMTSMMANKQAMMKGKKDMQEQTGMMDKQMMMQMMMRMMASLSFEQRLEIMQDHGNQMLATSKAGSKFYSSLTSEQKKKLNDMPKQMKSMNKDMM